MTILSINTVLMVLGIRPFYQPPIYYDKKEDSDFKRKWIIRHKGTPCDPLVLGEDGEYYWFVSLRLNCFLRVVLKLKFKKQLELLLRLKRIHNQLLREYKIDTKNVECKILSMDCKVIQNECEIFSAECKVSGYVLDKHLNIWF